MFEKVLNDGVGVRTRAGVEKEWKGLVKGLLDVGGRDDERTELFLRDFVFRARSAVGACVSWLETVGAGLGLGCESGRRRGRGRRCGRKRQTKGLNDVC